MVHTLWPPRRSLPRRCARGDRPRRAVGRDRAGRRGRRRNLRGRLLLPPAGRARLGRLCPDCSSGWASARRATVLELRRTTDDGRWRGDVDARHGRRLGGLVCLRGVRRADRCLRTLFRREERSAQRDLLALAQRGRAPGRWREGCLSQRVLSAPGDRRQTLTRAGEGRSILVLRRGQPRGSSRRRGRARSEVMRRAQPRILV